MTPTDTEKYVEDGTESVNEVSRAIYASARSRPGANQSAIDPYETSFKESRRGQTARFAEMDMRLQQEEQFRRELMSAIENVRVDQAGQKRATALVESDIKKTTERQAQIKEDLLAMDKDTDSSLKDINRQLKTGGKSAMIINVGLGGLGGTGGVLGLSALLRTLGSRRSKEEVAELQRQIQSIRVDIALHKPSPSGSCRYPIGEQGAKPTQTT